MSIHQQHYSPFTIKIKLGFTFKADNEYVCSIPIDVQEVFIRWYMGLNGAQWISDSVEEVHKSSISFIGLTASVSTTVSGSMRNRFEADIYTSNIIEEWGERVNNEEPHIISDTYGICYRYYLTSHDVR